MFGLLGSCKLNKINFGGYIEDIFTRMLYGEQVNQSFLPYNYAPRYAQRKDAV